MTTRDKPVEVEQVVCVTCLKEVPITETMVPEATDYVMHFCGLECYEKWKDQSVKADDQVEKPRS